jgi:hypothetical protein
MAGWDSVLELQAGEQDMDDCTRGCIDCEGRQVSYVGKYVCYGNEEGLFCWGRIESEVKVNTSKGLKEAFVLEGRMTGPHHGQVLHIHGKTTVRKEMLDLERDIFDKDTRGLEGLTDDQLFLLVLSGTVDGEVEGVHRGVMNMLKAEAGSALEKLAKEELEKRVGS